MRRLQRWVIWIMEVVGQKESDLSSLQKHSDVLIEYRSISGAYVLGVNASLAVDQESNRQAEDSSVSSADIRSSHDDGVVHMELLIESADWIGAVIHRDADDLQTLAPVLLLQIDEVRRLFAAGDAPGGPEIQQDDLAPIGR